MCQNVTTHTIDFCSSGFYNKLMYVYMKMNYETTINRIIDYKKLADILGILLIMTLLCSLARQNTLYYQTMNALPREQRQFGDIQEESDWATKINMGDGLHHQENIFLFFFFVYSLYFCFSGNGIIALNDNCDESNSKEVKT